MDDFICLDLRTNKYNGSIPQIKSPVNGLTGLFNICWLYALVLVV